jgi:hypothetical protein
MAGEAAEAEAAETATLDFEDFDTKPFSVEAIAVLGKAAKVAMDEAGDGAIVVVAKFEPELLGDILDWEAAIGDQLAVADPLDERVFNVVFVLDLADDFLKDVLDGDEAGGAAVLVGDDGDVDTVAAELGQKVVDSL